MRQIAISDINIESLDETEDHLKEINGAIEILKIKIDTSVEDSVNSAIDEVVEKFKQIDIAINNAGIGGPNKPSPDIEVNDWQKLMSVNLNGVWMCQRAEIRQMLKQDHLDPPPRGNRGVIVNTASMYGLVASSPQTCATAYTASKHGVGILQNLCCRGAN